MASIEPYAIICQNTIGPDTFSRGDTFYFYTGPDGRRAPRVGILAMPLSPVAVPMGQLLIYDRDLRRPLSQKHARQVCAAPPNVCG